MGGGCLGWGWCEEMFLALGLLQPEIIFLALLRSVEEKELKPK